MLPIISELTIICYVKKVGQFIIVYENDVITSYMFKYSYELQAHVAILRAYDPDTP